MHVVEVETRESVSETEAGRQWTVYDEIYERWFLTVPKAGEPRAGEVVDRRLRARAR